MNDNVLLYKSNSVSWFILIVFIHLFGWCRALRAPIKKGKGIVIFNMLPKKLKNNSYGIFLAWGSFDYVNVKPYQISG